jgi:hypothetical protein
VLDARSCVSIVNGAEVNIVNLSEYSSMRLVRRILRSSAFIASRFDATCQFRKVLDGN